MSNDAAATGVLDPSDLPRLEPGAMLGRRYRLEEELGRGGMGVVFRATDVELRRDVAVKVLSAAAGATDEAFERLMREARVAAALNHPNIVGIFDIGSDRGWPFLVMELVEGQSLETERPADYKAIVEIGRQICNALEHAHEKGIVHRDLKPQNVLFSGGGRGRRVKLADLGLALASSERARRITSEGGIVGTAAYMAPEQALGGTVDGRTDLYALGVVLYELVTGRLPFCGDKPLEIVSQHIYAPVVPPRALRPDVPAGLDAVIVRLLAKDAEQRFATANDARTALVGSLKAQVAAVADSPGAATVAILDALSRGRLIGREAELAEARGLWRRTREGIGHCVLISGEPGVGKTRLARELTVQAALDGAVVFWGACYENDATTPYLPFNEAVRRWVREQTDDGALRTALGEAAGPLARLAPEIEARLGGMEERPALSPHEERLLFFDAAAGFLRSLAADRGVLLAIDDLQWADSGSLWLLAHLLRSLKDARVLVVGTYREVELDRAHPLSKALVDWNRERLATRLVIRRFTPAQTRAQLQALIGEAVTGEFADAIHRETEGNPFFVEEVLKALIESGSVWRKATGWARRNVQEIVIPQSLKEAIGHRLDRVSPECNDMLRAAAVLGKTFRFRELLAVAGEQGEDALLNTLDEAVGAQLLLPDRDEAFAFSHDKIREVLYTELNPIRRRRLHRKTAEALESMCADTRVAVERLAHHHIEAGEHDRGLYWARLAGQEADRLFAYDEAVKAYGRALECAEALGRDDDRLELEEAIGTSLIAGGEFVPAFAHFERALDLCPNPRVRARLQSGAAMSLVTIGDPRGLEYCALAAAVFDPEKDPLETAGILSLQGRFHHLAMRHGEAAALLERAATLVAPVAARTDPPLSSLEASTIIQVFSFAAGAYQHLGRFEDANRWAWRSVEFGQAHKLPSAEANGYEFLGENATGTGHWREGFEYAAREKGIAERTHSRERLGWSRLSASWCALGLEDYETAMREAQIGLELARAIGERRLASLMMSTVAYAHAGQGRLDEALSAAREMLADAEQLKLPYMHTEALRCVGTIRRMQGDLDDALRCFEQVIQITEGTDAAVSRLWMGPAHIETLVAAGRRDEALARLADYERLTDTSQSPRFSGEAARLRAELGASA